MARASVTTQEITRDGTVADMTVPIADGDVVDTGRTIVMVANNSGSAITVTVQATASQDGLPVEDLTVDVADGDTALIGPLVTRTFGQPAGADDSGGDDSGRAYVDYSAVTSVTRTVLRI